MHVDDLRIYPVKALGGGLHDAADVDPWGLRGDRGWMVVDPSGRFLTQRQHHRMALIKAVATEFGISLAASSGARIDVRRPTASSHAAVVTVWGDTVPALLAEEVANVWITQELGLPCRLVYMADKAARRIKPGFAAPDASVSFADSFPVLLASLGSLADLNGRLAAPVPIGRFRPNIVVEGADPWAEDQWRLIRVGAVIFDVVKACDRCIVTTIDPRTGERPDKNEPLHTLGKFRRDVTGRIMFGQNLVPRTLGRIRVGDDVEVLERGSSNVELVNALLSPA